MAGFYSPLILPNIDFDGWADYLADPPLAMAILDRIVDGAIILKLTGKSYRAGRVKKLAGSTKPIATKSARPK